MCPPNLIPSHTFYRSLVHKMSCICRTPSTLIIIRQVFDCYEWRELPLLYQISESHMHSESDGRYEIRNICWQIITAPQCPYDSWNKRLCSLSLDKWRRFSSKKVLVSGADNLFYYFSIANSKHLKRKINPVYCSK